MTTEKTDNCLIAEFMGWRKATNGYMVPNLYSVASPDFSTGETEFNCDEMEFDSQWNWLMPVVEKIDKLYSESFPGNEEFIRRLLAKEKPLDGPYMDVIAIPIATPIIKVYKAVVEFIKWYNTQSK